MADANTHTRKLSRNNEFKFNTNTRTSNNRQEFEMYLIPRAWYFSEFRKPPNLAFTNCPTYPDFFEDFLAFWEARCVTTFGDGCWLPIFEGGMIACTCMVPTLAKPWSWTLVCTPSEPWSWKSPPGYRKEHRSGCREGFQDPWFWEGADHGFARVGTMHVQAILRPPTIRENLTNSRCLSLGNAVFPGKSPHQL